MRTLTLIAHALSCSDQPLSTGHISPQSDMHIQQGMKDLRILPVIDTATGLDRETKQLCLYGLGKARRLKKALDGADLHPFKSQLERSLSYEFANWLQQDKLMPGICCYVVSARGSEWHSAD